MVLTIMWMWKEVLLGCKINIEYKSGPGSIDKENFIREFVERDLNNGNITNLSQLEWRIEDAILKNGLGRMRA